MELNESQTRAVLINPLLEKAEWNLSDRTQVGFEIPVAGYDPTPWNGITDYCLHAPSGQVLAVVEAKRTSRSPREESDELSKASITVKLMRGTKANGIMHHKMVIYDGRVVQTGSFNWTDNASCCSWENSFFLAEQKVVRRYQEKFDRMWNRE